MKFFLKIFSVLLAASAAIISAAGEYQVLVLGDMHHDNMKFHDLSENPPPFHYNPAEVRRNLPNSEHYQPRMLKTAGKVAAQARMVIQVGDLTQGDCGSKALHKAMLESAYNTLKTAFPDKPLYLTPGNHDYRGPGAKAAYWEFNRQYMSKETGTAVKTPDYSVRHGQDVYIFLDAAGGGAHLNFLKAELKKHQDARYKFVIGHYALLPLPGMRAGCMFFDKGWEKPREQMLKLFLEYDVIYICGHIHASSVVDYRTDAGNISQLMAFSILSPKLTKPSLELRGKEKYSTELPRVLPRYQQALESLQPGIEEFYYAKNPGGYVILNVSDRQVDAVFYLNWQDKPYTTVTLRKNNTVANNNKQP